MNLDTPIGLAPGNSDREANKPRDTRPITDVVFRVDKGEGGDVFALFPGEPGTINALSCSCFQHVGQHSSADLRACIASSRPATPDEYAALKRELEATPYEYRLRVLYRINHTRFLQMRRDKINRKPT